MVLDMEEDKSSNTEKILNCEKCKSIFWNLKNLLRNDSGSHTETHHFFNELNETSRCDEFMPEFANVRQTVYEYIKKKDETLSNKMGDIVLPSPKEVDILKQTYSHYHKFLDRYVNIYLYQNDKFYFLLRKFF